MFDFIIKNGLIVDGSRKKPFYGSLYAKDGKIVKITADEPGSGMPEAKEFMDAKEVIDAKGHVVAPGFINLHTHSDNSFLTNPTYESMLGGGVTFELCGQCGLSSIPLRRGKEPNCPGKAVLGLTEKQIVELPADMDEYASRIEKTGISINVGMMIGHGALRAAVIGWEQRALTEPELKEMCDILDRELKKGAMGVTFGLIYPPGSFCDTEEIKALARVCAANGKVLAVHMRNENRKVFEALDEMLEVAAETGVRLEISHLKLMGKTVWGRSSELLAKIDMARAKGISIHADQYPYDASHSNLTSSFPKQAMDGGYDALTEHLKDDAWWDQISEHGTLPEMEFRGGAENITINEINGTDWPEIIGKTLPQIAEMLGTTVAEAVRQVLIRCKGRVMCIYHNMSMEDVLNIMSQRDVSVVSDGTAYNLSNYGGKPHPRNIGTFPRFFRLVREHRLMPIEDAVYKVSGLPSTIMGTDDRFGFLKEGYDATITVFDPETITDHATYEEPTLKNEGIDYVFVAGEKVLDHGVITDARPGRCIRRRKKRGSSFH